MNFLVGNFIDSTILVMIEVPLGLLSVCIPSSLNLYKTACSNGPAALLGRRYMKPFGGSSRLSRGEDLRSGRLRRHARNSNGLDVSQTDMPSAYPITTSDAGHGESPDSGDAEINGMEKMTGSVMRSDKFADAERGLYHHERGSGGGSETLDLETEGGKKRGEQEWWNTMRESGQEIAASHDAKAVGRRASATGKERLRPIDVIEVRRDVRVETT